MGIYEDVALLQEQMTGVLANIEDIEKGVALTENADLNTLGFGTYYIPNITVSATILNKPVERNSNALVLVKQGASNEKIMYYLINTKVENVNNKIYYRYYYDNSWSEWFTGYLRNDDTGWLPLPLASGVSEHNSSSFPCRYRKIGNKVYVQGCIKGFSTVEKLVFTLPEGFRPSKPFYMQNATNGGKTDTYNVQATNGNVERVGTTLATTSLSNDNYHFINMEFLTD